MKFNRTLLLLLEIGDRPPFSLPKKGGLSPISVPLLLVAGLLAGCASISEFPATVTNDTISVPLASITPGEKIKIVRAKQLAYDILLVLGDNNNHRALEMRCTHANNILSASNTGLFCTFHGSTFDLNGEVTSGPAMSALKNFRTSEANNQITIYLK